MKLVFFTHYTELYGANKSLINLIEGLIKEQKTDVVLVVPALGKITDFAKLNNISCLLLPFYNEIQYNTRKGITSFFKNTLKFFYNWYLVLKHSRKLDGADIIHSNSSATFIGAYFAQWKKIPHVWHIREYGWEDYKFTYNFGYGYFQHWLNKSTAIIGISNSIYAARISTSPVKLKAVIYNGVIFSKDIPVNELPNKTTEAPPPKMIFAIIGLICEGKNQMEALRAFQLVHLTNKKTELWIIGDGEAKYIKSLKEFINKNHLQDYIKFTGYLDNIKSIYDSIHCLVMCSANEAFGRVTVEAMVNNVPVIGYNNAGTSEIIRDNDNGLLYSNGYTELSEKMKLLLKDNDLSLKIKHNARTEVPEKYTIEKYSAGIYNIYMEVLFSSH